VEEDGVQNPSDNLFDGGWVCEDFNDIFWGSALVHDLCFEAAFPSPLGEVVMN